MGDVLFTSWRNLKIEWDTIQSEIESENFDRINRSCGKSLTPIMDKVLVYPGVDLNSKKKKCRKRNYPSHMTSDGCLELLEKADLEKREKEMRTEVRKKKQAEKKKAKEELQLQKKHKIAAKKVTSKEKKRKKTVESDEEDSSCECAACCLGGELLEWISCDDCKLWFHMNCVHIPQDERDDYDTDSEWVCDLCN